jgi:hypothetical protein
MRTLTEILKEADNSKSISELNKLSEELYKNRDKMPLHEVEFGLEHMIDIAHTLINEMKIIRMLNE